MNTTIKGRYAAIRSIILLLLALIYVVQAAQVSPIINSVRIGTNGVYDTTLRSGWLSIDSDSLYKWIAAVRGGTGNYTVKIMGQFNGVAGDTITVDSVAFTGGYESYIATVNGDSLLDLAWPQWTAYSAAARIALKTSPDLFRYQILIKSRTGTGQPVYSLSRLTN